MSGWLQRLRCLVTIISLCWDSLRVIRRQSWWSLRSTCCQSWLGLGSSGDLRPKQKTDLTILLLTSIVRFQGSISFFEEHRSWCFWNCWPRCTVRSFSNFRFYISDWAELTSLPTCTAWGTGFVLSCSCFEKTRTAATARTHSLIIVESTYTRISHLWEKNPRCEELKKLTFVCLHSPSHKGLSCKSTCRFRSGCRTNSFASTIQFPCRFRRAPSG